MKRLSLGAKHKLMVKGKLAAAHTANLLCTQSCLLLACFSKQLLTSFSLAFHILQPLTLLALIWTFTFYSLDLS